MIADDASRDIPWLQASQLDFESIDSEAPIASCMIADARALSDLYLQECSKLETTEPAKRVYSMLAAICGMHCKPSEPNEPFGAMMTWADRRTAIPTDFNDQVELLSVIAAKVRNLTLRARLSDVCWFLQRNRTALGLQAANAYADIIDEISKGTLSWHYGERDVLHHNSCDIIMRALQIAWIAGRNSPEMDRIRALSRALREKALVSGDVVVILWFSEQDLNCNTSDAAEIGDSLKAAITRSDVKIEVHKAVAALRLAAEAYHAAKRESDKNDCLSLAADRLEEHANAYIQQPIIASHFLSDAISQLHGLPGKKEHRAALRHRLIDLQAGCPDDLSTFEQSLDLEDIVRALESRMENTNLFEKLFIFADLIHSRDITKLEEEARETISKHPLSNLFGAIHLDRHGKTIARSKGSKIGEKADNDAVRHQIAQSESLYRKIVSAGRLEPALQVIMSKHCITEQVLLPLFQNSPFIPPSLLRTFARGFTRYFQGDFISATYILVPMLEAYLRHLLKSQGVDVTRFSDETQIQEGKGISLLFQQMQLELEEIITPSITADLERVFLAKPGPYLRHAVAHGLLHDADPYSSDTIYANALIYRLCILPLFRHRQQLQEELCRDPQFSEVVRSST